MAIAKAASSALGAIWRRPGRSAIVSAVMFHSPASNFMTATPMPTLRRLGSAPCAPPRSVSKDV
eukprot:3274591-Pyramimonas_sp.AAC.1